MDAEQALQRVRERLSSLPTCRPVNTGKWDAIRIRDALNVVDQVLAELERLQQISEACPRCASPDRNTRFEMPAGYSIAGVAYCSHSWHDQGGSQ